MNRKGENMHFSDYVGNEYMEWHEGQVIIINAPTGSGKSSFVEENFKEHAFTMGKRILYVTNRVLLRNQMIERQKQRICDEAMTPKPFWLNFKRGEEGNLVFVTYQQIEHALLFGYRQAVEYFASFDIAIADECHYFLTDSIFNPNTIVSFQFLLSTYKNRQIIFMSATMRNFYGILINYLNRATSQSDLFYEGMFPAFKYYEMQADYTGVEFDYITENREIAKKVENFPDDGKILIFVSSIAEGKEIRDLLKTVVPLDQIFLFSSQSVKTEKGAGVREELVAEEKFSYRVLISTALLDSGVNIVDESVKYIFLLQTNEEEAVQMLGRRRRSPGESLYVCLHARSQAYFKKIYNRLNYEINYMNTICRQEMFNREYFDIIIAKDFYNLEKAEVLRKFVAMDMQKNAFNRYFINEFSCQRMYQLMEEARVIVNEFDMLDNGAYLFRQGGWFALDESTLKFLTPQTYLEQIVEYVQIYCDLEMNRDTFDQFRTALMPLLHQADRKMFPKKTELAKWQKMNHFFSKYMLPFCIHMTPKTKTSDRAYLIKKSAEGLIYETEEK